MAGVTIIYPGNSVSILERIISLQPQKRDILVAALTAVAIAIHILESTLPTVLPGFKPGLANVITLLCFFAFGLKVAIQITLMRVFVGSLLIGSFLTPTFLMSLSGAVFSLISMSLLRLLAGTNNQTRTGTGNQMDFNHLLCIPVNGYIGPLGVSMVAAASHIFGQFFIAWNFFLPQPQLVKILPLLLMLALISGLANGIVCLLIIKSASMIKFLRLLH